jgi:hypothetical protein
MTAARSTAAVRTPDDHLIDWRFLVPGGALGRVAVAGRVDPAVRQALEVRADAVLALDEPTTGHHDVAVLADPDAATLATATARMAPGGSLWISAPRRRRRAATLRALRASGLEVSTWWHRPSSQDTRCLVALDQPRAAATVLRTLARRSGLGTLEPAVARWAGVHRWGRDVGVLATTPLPDDGNLRRDALATPEGAAADALITPRFASSRAVVAVTTTPDGRRLRRVAKIARDPQDDAFIAHEGQVLDQLRDLSPTAPAAPGNHDLIRRGGRAVLVEDAVLGSPLDRRAVRADPYGALAAGIRWVEQVPTAAPSPVQTDGRGQRLLMASLAALAARPDGPGPKLVERAGAALRPVLTATLPAPFEHGDLSHPNLFATTGGALVAIDWEQGGPNGLPLHDLVFFVGYLAESVHPPRDEAQRVACHARAMGDEGWASDAIDQHLTRLEIDPSLRPALALACWTRHLAAATRRTVAGRTAPVRYEVLWRAALADAEAAS